MNKLFAPCVVSTSSYEIPKIKWSRFIGQIFPITSKEDIDELLAQVASAHPGANHHCWAARYEPQLHTDLFGTQTIMPKHSKSSDDGEPANTAWKPILQILEKQNLINVLLVVTRYFWGTLLGVGWLIQAYSEAAKAVVAHAELGEEELLVHLPLHYSFELEQPIRHVVQKYGALLQDEQYDTEVSCMLVINQWYLDSFRQELKDASKGMIEL